MTSESKTAEFAKLFDFFERLASHKSHSSTDESPVNIDDIDLPADLAPVVNNLANLVGVRSPRADTRKNNGGRKRSHTIATTSRPANDDDVNSDDDSDESLAKFPLGKQYTFTFRLMVHKLYQMQDWKQKVKDVLERSRTDYKPLAETTAAAKEKEVEKREQPEAKQDGRVHFKVDNITAGSRRPSVRPRAHSALVLAKCKEAGPLSPTRKSPKSPKSPVMNPRAPAQLEDLRAIKKRCIGRRKSFSGPAAAEVGRIGGRWVYDAKVSSAEVTGRGEAQYQGVNNGMHLKAYEGLVMGAPGKVEGRRRVSLGAAGHGMPGRLQNADSGIAKRRRALSVMDNMMPAVQAQRKRPLEY